MEQNTENIGNSISSRCIEEAEITSDDIVRLKWGRVIGAQSLTTTSVYKDGQYIGAIIQSNLTEEEIQPFTNRWEQIWGPEPRPKGKEETSQICCPCSTNCCTLM